MLGKLFKYEMKATSRIFLPVYIAVVLFAALGRLVTGIDLFSNELSWLSGIFMGTYVLVIVATAVLTYIVVIQRFYKNLLTDEGYLMFTLPVKPSRLILSKLFSAMLWSVCSLVVILLSLVILAANAEFFHRLPELWQTFVGAFQKEFGGYSTGVFIEIIALIITALFASMMLFFVSIAVGQLISRHKIAGAFAAYLLISFIVEIVLVIILLLVGAAQGFNLSSVDNFTGITVILPIMIVLELVLGCVYFIVANLIFKKRINLE